MELKNLMVIGQIFTVLTDYSSIAADFSLAGGKKIEYYIEDKKDFLKSTEGYSEFFEIEMVKHSFSSTPKDLELNLRIILEDLAQEKIKKTKKIKFDKY